MLKDKTFIIAIAFFLLGIFIMLLGHVPLANSSPTSDTADNSIKGTLQSSPQRIICITPLGTELIYALGQQEKLIGIDIFSDYPPETSKIQKVGSFFDTNFETIATLKPDLIISLGVSQKISKYCQENNIRQLHLKMSDMASIYDDIILTGEILNCPKAAKELCNKIFNQLNEIRRKVIETNNTNKKDTKIFLCMSRKPGTLSNLGTVGPDTCLTDLIDLVGGVNIFDDMPLPYGDISKESLISRSPDIIIEAVAYERISSSSQQMKEQWSILDIPATKNGNVFFIDENILHRPGVRSVDIAQCLFDCIYATKDITTNSSQGQN